MTHQQLPNLEPPRFEQSKPMLLAGISARYNCEQRGGIPSQWQRFMPYFEHLPDRIDHDAYGVMYNTDDAGNMEYLCGVQVRDFARTPPELTTLRIPSHRYAIFKHREHISTISGTFAAIWTRWLPESGHEVADAPMLEVYGQQFDPHSGHGGLEVWLPIRN